MVADRMIFYVTDQGPGEGDGDNFIELAEGIWARILVPRFLTGPAANEARTAGLLEFLAACVDNSSTHDYDALGFSYIATLGKIAASCENALGQEKSRSLLNALTAKFRVSDWKDLLEGCHNPYSPS